MVWVASLTLHPYTSSHSVVKWALMLILDVFLVCFALYSSFWLRFEGQITQQCGDYMVRSLIPIGLLSLVRFGAFTCMFNMHFPRSVYSLFFVLTVVFVGSSRFFIVSLQIVLGCGLVLKGWTMILANQRQSLGCSSSWKARINSFYC